MSNSPCGSFQNTSLFHRKLLSVFYFFSISDHPLTFLHLQVSHLTSRVITRGTTVEWRWPWTGIPERSVTRGGGTRTLGSCANPSTTQMAPSSGKFCLRSMNYSMVLSLKSTCAGEPNLSIWYNCIALNFVWSLNDAYWSGRINTISSSFFALHFNHRILKSQLIETTGSRLNVTPCFS